MIGILWTLNWNNNDTNETNTLRQKTRKNKNIEHGQNFSGQDSIRSYRWIQLFTIFTCSRTVIFGNSDRQKQTCQQEFFGTGGFLK